MAYVHPAWVEHQRKRFTRYDAQRYWGPHADRLVPKDVLKALGWQDPYEAKANSASASQHSISDDEAVETKRLKTLREIASLRWELTLLRFRFGGTARRKANFNPNQPRVRAGSSDGGQWTSDGSGQGRNDPRVLSDATPDNEWKPGAQYAQNRAPRGPVLINGRWHQPTPAQSARLAIAEAQSRDAIKRVQDFDPRWRPTSSTYETVEGLIRGHRAETEQAQAKIKEFASNGIGSGPHAREYIPGRGPERNFTAEEVRNNNENMSKHGCHTCGTHDSGTRSGNAILDHQPPIALSSSGTSYRLYPQCLHCSLRQGGHVLHLLRGR
jgi:hypothetical protein